MRASFVNMVMILTESLVAANGKTHFRCQSTRGRLISQFSEFGHNIMRQDDIGGNSLFTTAAQREGRTGCGEKFSAQC